MIISSMPFPPYNFKMAANEGVILRSIRDVVGEVLRDLQASVTLLNTFPKKVSKITG